MADEELDEALLDEIRRAAFELRRTDPREAVRVLRRAAEKGGPAEVLARGALGEIYFDDLGDLDAAEAEFRKVLKAAPHLPAAELGLARVLREGGRLDEAEASLEKALHGFAREAAALQSASQRNEELPDGSEETVLATLEVAVELAELRHERGSNGSTRVPLDEGVLGFALRGQLFDTPGQTDDEDDLADWTRFHALWARLRMLTGRAAEAAAALREAEAAGQLAPVDASILLSQALEDAGDAKGALREAERRLQLVQDAGEAYDPEDVSHAAGLSQQLGDEPNARAILQRALDQAQRLLPSSQGEQREELEEAVKSYREWLGPQGMLVGLGRPRQ